MYLSRPRAMARNSGLRSLGSPGGSGTCFTSSHAWGSALSNALAKPSGSNDIAKNSLPGLPGLYFERQQTWRRWRQRRHGRRRRHGQAKQRLARMHVSLVELNDLVEVLQKIVAKNERMAGA